MLQGAFVIDDEGNAAGKFIIDMNTIAITDMTQDNPMYNQLLNHLRDGFFAVEEYPTVEFDLKKAIKKSGGMYDIIGNLKLKGVSREITFPAQVEIGETEMTAKANFFVDRTAWGIDEVIQIADKYIEFGVDFVFERL
jgi:polyisoprenoid-binding protein YceI